MSDIRRGGSGGHPGGGRPAGSPAGGRAADSRTADGRPSDGRPTDGCPAGSSPAGGRPVDTRPAGGRPVDARPGDDLGDGRSTYAPGDGRSTYGPAGGRPADDAGDSRPVGGSRGTGELRFGYGTNGLTDLRLDDALGLLADLGYEGAGLTLDHMHLDPLAPDLAERTRHVARRLDRLGLTATIETGARYVLDPRRKHGPSLLDPDSDRRAERVRLLTRAVQVAADLNAHAVHCFSGITPAGTSDDTAWKRLADALGPVLDAAATAGVPLAVEPEPGHLLSSLADFHRLRTEVGAPDPGLLGLTLDIGHCQCLEPLPPADCVRSAAPWLHHVQIEDMCRGVHEHLPFGDGEIDFPPVLEALAATGYQGLTVVELPRHSHAGPQLAAESLAFLREAVAPGRRTAVLASAEGGTP